MDRLTGLAQIAGHPRLTGLAQAAGLTQAAGLVRGAGLTQLQYAPVAEVSEMETVAAAREKYVQNRRAERRHL